MTIHHSCAGCTVLELQMLRMVLGPAGRPMAMIGVWLAVSDTYTHTPTCLCSAVLKDTNMFMQSTSRIILYNTTRGAVREGASS